MKARKNKIYFVLLVLFIAACGTGINLFSLNEEVQLGEKFDKQITESPDYPIYNNTSVKNYIRDDIFREILNAPEIKKDDVFPYQLEVIDDDKTLNAFAVPGGFVYIYTGLIKYLGSEAALAGVVAHEIAHAELRHSTQRMTEQYGLQLLANIALGNNPSQISVMVANLFSGLTLLAHSRSMEDEADKYAVRYLNGTKFYAGGVKFFFERMKADGKVEEGGSGIAVFLSTHPDPIERINSTNDRLREQGIPVYHYNDYSQRGVFRRAYETNILNKMR